MTLAKFQVACITLTSFVEILREIRGNLQCSVYVLLTWSPLKFEDLSENSV